jgi:GNAT superfamily N-acetyltransferase
MKTNAAAIQISVSANPTEDERAAIIGGLIAYNDARATPARHEELAVVVRAGQAVVGGLLGHTSWSWLFIRQLWLAEGFRGSGLGGALLRAAEAEAIRRGCAAAHCDTFDFQALPFYRKLGYEVFGQLSDYPQGHTRFFLRKHNLRRPEEENV